MIPGHHPLSAGSELLTDEPEAGPEDRRPQVLFLLHGEAVHSIEPDRLVRIDRPCAHREAELDVSLDLAGVGGAIEKPVLDTLAGEEAVKVEGVIPSPVVMRMVDVTVTTVFVAVPVPLQAPEGDVLVFPEDRHEVLRDRLAPAVFPVTDLEGIVDKILAGAEELHQPAE